jgi:hypothetical protein
MTQAFQPAIVSKEGSGDRKNTITMSIQACKWGALLSLIFAIPLIVEIENLLQLWLKTPPAYAAEICQWLLGMAIVDRLTSGQMMAVNAYGKIALYELIQGLILFSALPVMWLFFRWSLEPVFAGFTLFITMLFYCIGRVIFAKCLLGFPIWMWIRDVGLPIMLILILTFLAGSLSVENLSEGFLRLCLTGIITSSVALLLACLVLFKKNDRLLLLNYAKSLVSKIPILGELMYRK